MRLLGPVGTVVVSNAPRWNPRKDSTLVAWWNADDHATANMTDDGSGLISSWSDRIGGLALTGTTTARPTWAGTSFNNRRAGVTGDGVANTLRGTTFGNIPVTSAAGWILLVSSTPAIPSAVAVEFGYGGVSGAVQRRFQTNITTGVENAADGTTGSGGAGSAIGLHVDVADFSGTSMNFWHNGTAAAGNPYTIASLNTTATRISLLANLAVTAANFSASTIRFAMVGTGVLTTAQRQLHEGYATWDGAFVGALAAGHPYKNHAP